MAEAAEMFDIVPTNDLEYYIGRTDKYAFAMGALGVQLDESSRVRLATALQLAQAIDRRIDVADPDVRAARTTDVLMQLDNEAGLRECYPALAKEKIGAAAYDTIIHRLGKQVIRLNEPIKRAETLRRHLALRQLEGRLYAGILAASLSAEVKAHPRFELACNCLSASAEFGNVRDTYIDLEEDYANGEHDFAPNMRNRLRIAAWIGVAILRSWHNGNRAKLPPVDTSLPPRTAEGDSGASEQRQ